MINVRIFKITANWTLSTDELNIENFSSSSGLLRRCAPRKEKPPIKIGGTTKNTSPTVMKIYRKRK